MNIDNSSARNSSSYCRSILSPEIRFPAGTPALLRFLLG
jgi:hypothetical protein